MNYRVNVYTLDTIFSPFKETMKVLVSPHARQTGGGSESVYIKTKGDFFKESFDIHMVCIALYYQFY